jgi:hypothetical protein
MFLAHLAARGLLEIDPCTDVLAAIISHPQQLEIVKAAIFGLETAGITTANHMNWLLEVVGRGLSFPFSQSQIVHRCVDIYSRWIFQSSIIPPVFALDPHKYLPVLTRQLSQVFEDHTPFLADQRNLCTEVLKLFGRIADFCCSDAINREDSIDTLVRVLIGVADQLLTYPEQFDDSQLTLLLIFPTGIRL